VTNISRRALLVFTRSPEAEAISKGFRSEGGAPLFHAFLSSWVDLARKAAVHLVVASPAPCRRRLEGSGVAREATFQTQRGGGFGDRLADAACAVFGRDFESVIVVGGDAPAITADELRSSFAAIEAGKMVVGPSVDGGIYLVGLRASEAPLLRTITLRDGRVCERFTRAGEDAGRRIHFLSRRAEIDSVRDAGRAWKASPWDSNWAPYQRLLAFSVASRPNPVPPRVSVLPGASGFRFSPRAPPVAA
jgi:glycosyltransferase A (GT-A) superfamily protein (DUF2064 family)